MAFLLILLITGMTLSGSRATHVAHHAAIGTGIGLAISALFDLRAGYRNLIRPDFCAMLALYFLTLFEFLFPQGYFDMLVTADTAMRSVPVVLWGFAGLAAGRHLVNLRRHPLRGIFTQEVPRGWVLLIFWGCFTGGFFYMAMCVNFNVVKMVDFWLEPRFTQPWQRGRLGDWKAMLYELSMLLYIVPPLAGIIVARRQKHGKFTLFAVLCGFLLTVFYAFCTGTRNLFLSYLVTFLIGYGFAAPARRRFEFMFLCAVTVVTTLAATVLMLAFREVGLRNYLNNKTMIYLTRQETMFVDYNLFTISRLVDTMPAHHAYLGWEVPYLAVIRPVPRAVWPGKPKGLSLTMEDAVGAEGWTVAASFVGEAYMSHGIPTVFLAGLILGALMGWWSRLASPENSDLGILIYASGFFAAVISMRSIYVLTTAILPTAVSLVLAAGLVGIVRSRQRRRERFARIAGGRLGPMQRRRGP
jgi:oligosaccharide repeat unit polymerase